MPGAGQFTEATEIQVTSEFGADIADDGTAPPFPPATGIAISGLETATGFLRVLRVNAAGELVVSIGPPTPGTTITSPVHVAVGVGATVPLPAPPAGTTNMTVQNVSGGATQLLVRESPGVAGTGLIIVRFGSRTFDEAVATVEVEHVAGPAGSAAIQFEGP